MFPGSQKIDNCLMEVYRYTDVCNMCHQITSSQWSFLTDDAKDLITQMLEVDPSRRVTVENALKHPWIQVSCIN